LFAVEENVEDEALITLTDGIPSATNVTLSAKNLANDLESASMASKKYY
jgi:hypothetical protein